MLRATHYVFLLGGYDLEMATIRDLLCMHFPEEQIRDAHLAWGAKLSSYKADFNEDACFVGIELICDIAPPRNYIVIDHHNDNSSRASSLEQMITFLNEQCGITVEFSRHLQLVAANDASYIPGMTSLGATSEEIRQIREQDRMAQGVTPQEESEAELIANSARTTPGKILTIRTHLEHFSPIVDRLYPFTSLLIYNEKEVNYYGKNAHLLASAKSLQSESSYSGGGIDGYWGDTKPITKEFIDLITQTLSR